MPPVKQLFALTILATAAEAQQPMVPVLNQMVPDVVLVAGEDGETFALGDHFGMEEIRDDAVRLMAEWTLLDGTVKTVDIDFLLFENRTPITRDNFLGYVNRGDYTNMFVHRLVPGFVIQGGGFTVVNGAGGGPASANVATQPPIQNEFGVSNTLEPFRWQSSEEIPTVPQASGLSVLARTRTIWIIKMVDLLFSDG